jgi:REP element-mobilizing transposase RayT
MAFNPEIHHRHSIRLPGYDYSLPGYYFVTMCARDRECSFGNIENNKIVLNETGMIVEKQWHDLPVHFPGIELDRMVVMPNHLHGIIAITDPRRGAVVAPIGIITSFGTKPPHEGVTADAGLSTRVGAGLSRPKRITPFTGATTTDAKTAGAMTAPLRRGRTLGQMVAWFKYESTKEINRVVTNNPEMKIWQRNFYERIIRNEEELNRIRNYIVTNPETWGEDENYVCVGAGLSRPNEIVIAVKIE